MEAEHLLQSLIAEVPRGEAEKVVAELKQTKNEP